ncbi:hypothetical protein [Paenibacillus dendritiformis]|uniref:hypothetical protein n=1 Tax=Paenibacillus dendritiformis TaxID=130049 RepID=UPI0018CEF35B|nr:hypothetical protein [Paenibacillus dendritiformis]
MEEAILHNYTDSTASGVVDGIFEGWSSVIYIGKTANAKEFKYTYRTHFQWSRLPNFYWTDSVGHSWGGDVVGVQSHGDYVIDTGLVCNGCDRGFEEIDQSSVYGTKGTVDLFGIEGIHYGTLRTEVRIPVEHKGRTAAFASVYGHAYTPSTMSISIEPIGIDISGYGDKWSWRESFIVKPD